jgi:hypothetical protein
VCLTFFDGHELASDNRITRVLDWDLSVESNFEVYKFVSENMPIFHIKFFQGRREPGRAPWNWTIRVIKHNPLKLSQFSANFSFGAKFDNEVQ